MRTSVECPCGNHVGWWYTYEWGWWGQDPPEFIGVEDYTDDEGVVYCSQECLDAAHEEEEEHG